MKHRLVPLALVLLSCAAPANAQSLGMFRWQLQPYGSVLNLNVTQQGSVYLLNGFEAQCSNPSLPAWGIAVPQLNGSILIGVTTITEQGNGLHTRASISPSDFSGGWSDNANSTGSFVFNPGNTCPGGPRVGPIEPEPALAAWPGTATDANTLGALLAEIDSLRKRLSDLETKKQ
jgi:hypothetical protein